MTGDGAGKKVVDRAFKCSGSNPPANSWGVVFQRVQLLREVVRLTGSAFFNSLKKRFSPRRKDRKELMRVLQKRYVVHRSPLSLVNAC